MKKKTLSIAILSIVLILAIFSAYPIGEVQATDINIPYVTKLYQNDERWKDQKMDNSDDTIGDYGCGLTADTMLINQALEAQEIHEKKPDGTEWDVIDYTPAELNTLLNDRRYEQAVDAQGNPVKNENDPAFDHMQTMNGWKVPIDDDGNPIGSSTTINVGSLVEAVKADTEARSFEGEGLQQKEYHAPGFCGIPNDIGSEGVILDENYKYIFDELEAGRPVVVRTYDNKHWVLVKSFEQAEGQPEGRGKYNIADPWRKEDGTSIEWLDHEDYDNKIWDWGTGVSQKGGVHDPYEVPCEYWIDPEYLYDPVMNPDQYGPQVLTPSFPFPEVPEDGVGGIVIPVDKLGLLAPYIGLASTIVVATVATAVYVRRIKRRKEKQ